MQTISIYSSMASAPSEIDMQPPVLAAVGPWCHCQHNSTGHAAGTGPPPWGRLQCLQWSVQAFGDPHVNPYSAGYLYSIFFSWSANHNSCSVKKQYSLHVQLAFSSGDTLNSVRVLFFSGFTVKYNWYEFISVFSHRTFHERSSSKKQR